MSRAMIPAVLVLTPPPVDAGEAPMNIKTYSRSTEAGPRVVMGRV